MPASVRLTQFAAYIAGKVFISSHIMGRSVLLQLSRYTEDHTLQFSLQCFFCFSAKLAHIAISTQAFSEMDTASASLAVSTTATA